MPLWFMVLLAGCGDAGGEGPGDAGDTPDALIVDGGGDGSVDASADASGPVDASGLRDAGVDSGAASCAASAPDLFDEEVYRDGFNWLSAECTSASTANDEMCPPASDGVASYARADTLLDDPVCYGGGGGCIRHVWDANEQSRQLVPHRGSWAPGGESNGFYVRHRLRFGEDWYSPEGYMHAPQHLKYSRFCRGGEGCNDMLAAFDIGNAGADSREVRLGLATKIRQRDGEFCGYSIFGGSRCPEHGIEGGLCGARFAFEPETWHTVEWFFDLGDPGASNGQCRLTIDGEVLAEDSGFDVWGDPDPSVTGPLTHFKWIFSNTSNAAGACDTEDDHWPPCSTEAETRTIYQDDLCITGPDANAREGACACTDGT